MERYVWDNVGIGVGPKATQVGRDINLFITKHGHEGIYNKKIISSSPQTKKSVEDALIPNILKCFQKWMDTSWIY